ncbi:MAG: hypothetical protein N3F63_08225 [Thermoplasmata archaeon]|nr:hypothetical protein [Thermoplasmata archaeon]
MSQRSEKEAFERAIRNLESVDVEVTGIRLDKYYSSPSYVERFGDAKVYVIPKKNATARGGTKWRNTMKEFVETPLIYLRQYYLRNHSESAFSADKRTFGWMVRQKREERIYSALSCRCLWHNLLNLFPL